jgi:hypothetical protein
VEKSVDAAVPDLRRGASRLSDVPDAMWQVAAKPTLAHGICIMGTTVRHHGDGG